MQTGQLALILALASSLLVALIGLYGTRTGALQSRRSDVDKIYQTRLESLEKQLNDCKVKNDELREKNEALLDKKDVEIELLKDRIQALREQHIGDLGSAKQCELLEEEVMILRRKLKRLNIDDDDEVIGV